MTEYRRIRPSEEDAALDLWIATLPVPPERLRYEYHLDPQQHERTFVAVNDAGEVVSALCYVRRDIGDAAGGARPVGCVCCLATRPDARGRGHAARLLELAAEAMREEGCAWQFLFTDVPAYYKRLGWRAMASRYREGALAAEPPADDGKISVRSYRPVDEPGGWSALAGVYAAYNASRPLALRRDAAYWRAYLPPRFAAPTALLLVASRRPDVAGTEAGMDGYLLAHLLDGSFVATEIASRPGVPGVAAALLGALAREARSRGYSGGRVYLPFEPEVDAALAGVFAGLTVGYHHAMLTKPLAPGLDEAEIDAIFAAPGAISWPSDDF